MNGRCAKPAARAAQWKQADLPSIHIAVNLSAAQLLQSDLAGSLARTLADTGFPASHLTLELTESMLMTAGDQAGRTIDSLKALGVALSLDDFGTGYSPLTYLRRLPIDEIKIDRSFVHGLPAQQDSAAIAGAIIALAGALGLQVVAEGVETAAELGFLRQFSHCRFQGYLFSKPVTGQRADRDAAGNARERQRPRRLNRRVLPEEAPFRPCTLPPARPL